MPRPVSSTATTGSLALAAVRLAWGAALLSAPGRVVGVLGGAATADSRRIERILGVRHLLQGTVELLAWPRWRRIGVTVDALHAASGVALAAADARWRRPAALDATITTAFAVGGAALR
jgi:hypothetical protein